MASDGVGGVAVRAQPLLHAGHLGWQEQLVAWDSMRVRPPCRHALVPEPPPPASPPAHSHQPSLHTHAPAPTGAAHLWQGGDQGEAEKAAGRPHAAADGALAPGAGPPQHHH